MVQFRKVVRIRDELAIKALSSYSCINIRPFLGSECWQRAYYSYGKSQSSNVVIAPAELIFIRLPNKQRTDKAFDARGSTEVIKLFEVGQYKRIKPIALQATPVLQSIIQQ
ncbi:MAG: hypothetical protein EZS28_028778 [Streblomastix strix]|uniref:Uncharacterized protein n=1 Tax=Streblomastix strix TaxID=222440 RepID=A0A5J4V0Y9_9EUKA|nr:MAG: hypothetical protein EZS28_028778 [Streblomastix strix]